MRALLIARWNSSPGAMVDLPRSPVLTDASFPLFTASKLQFDAYLFVSVATGR